MYKFYTKIWCSRSGYARKLFLIMKLIVILLVMALTQVSASTFGQDLTLIGKNVSVEKIFRAISDQTGYDVVVFTTKFNTSQKIDVNFKNASLDVVMQRLIRGKNLTYLIDEKTVIIKEGNHPVELQPLTAQPQIDKSGRVTDENGKPLPGASVVIKGQNRGALTGADGVFLIRNVTEKDILVISFTGYKSIEIQASKNLKSIRLIQLQVELDEVVITNGYQKIEKRKLTSAITSVKASDIVNPGMFSIDQALEGRIPGLFVMNNSGDIGVSPKIRIRGTSTILGNRDPLWVVDGVVVNDPVGVDPASINDLDFVNRLGNAISGLKPFDIEQIDVLKDASATALYGVRAANGVIVITTKKGKAGDPVINFNQSTSLTRRPRYTDHNINLMTSRERIDFSRDLISAGLEYSPNINLIGYEGALSNLYSGKFTYDEFQNQVHRLETVNTDWFDVLLNDATSTQNNLSVSGGTAKMNYFASIGLATQRGTLKGDKADQYTSMVKISTTINPHISWDVNLRANLQKNDFVASSLNALSYAYNTSRAIPAYNENGTPAYYKRYSTAFAREYGASEIDYYNFNISNEVRNSRNLIDNSGINLTSNLNLKLSSSLSAVILVNYSSNNSNDQTVYDANTFYSANLRNSEFGVNPNPARTYMPLGGEMKTNKIRNEGYLTRAQISYDRPIGKDSRDNLNILFGTEISSNKYNGYSLTRRGYLADRGQTFASIDPLKYPFYAQWALLNNNDIIKNTVTNLASAYFSGSYTINDKYIVNFNTRTDASNKFGSRSKEKFLPTYSISGRWDIDKDFFKNSKTVNLLALKASYGYQGNMLDNQSPELIIKQGAADPITGEYFSNIGFYPNPNLKWEKNRQVNIGLDFSFFSNKLQGTFNYFDKTTSNAFLNKTVSDINGLNSYVVNSGTIKNKGVEVSFSFTPINNFSPGSKNGGFSWRVDPQLGQIINRLISRGVSSKNIGETNANVYMNYLEGNQVLDGKAANTFYSYRFKGLDPESGYPTFYNDDPSLADKYKGQNIDQIVDQVMVASGRRIPIVEGGLLNVFSYKQFSFSFNLAYSFGSKIRLKKLYPNYQIGENVSSSPFPESNVDPIMTDRWRVPGDEARTNIPALVPRGVLLSKNLLAHYSNGQTYEYARSIWEMYDNSDARVVSGNYVKVKTANLRYTLSEDITRKLHLKQASVMLSGNNLYTFASRRLRGQDPEQSSFDDTIQLSPRSTFSITLDVSF